MTELVFYFQVHQPYRLAPSSWPAVDGEQRAFDQATNEAILRKVSERCYLPVNALLREAIAESEGRFRCAFSISGTALSQMEAWAPEVIESFGALLDSGCVELVCETSHHSLAAFIPEEFVAQVEDQRARIQRLFGVTPTTFRNTELILDDEVALAVESMGFDALLGEGADRLLLGKSPHLPWRPQGCEKLQLLLRDYERSDDIAFRFSNPSWEKYPLMADTYADWLRAMPGPPPFVGLFMDYETFGEHQGVETGVLDFLRHFIREALRGDGLSFSTPAELAASHAAAGEISFPGRVSWADAERDTSAWLGNPMQDSASEALWSLRAAAMQAAEAGAPELLEDWRRLTTSDHTYYMCTKQYSDQDVHEYFSPYPSPHEAFVRFMHALGILEGRIQSHLGAGQPEDQDPEPGLPTTLRPLESLARNLWWSWDAEATALFESLAPDAWEASGHNPMILLREADRDALAERAADHTYLERLQAVRARFEAYMQESASGAAGALPGPRRPVAYFSAEFGIHESLRIYSGGLGILAGDHLKSASDLSLPLIGVGLFYAKGYLKQALAEDGEQLSADIQIDPGDHPLELVVDNAGEPVILELALPGRSLCLRAWRAAIGRVDLYLLDSKVARNSPEDQALTERLYAGDEEMRIQQEIVLGCGGARLLQRMGVDPAVWHMNEGHAAFLAIERTRRLVTEEGLSFEEAHELVRGTTAFTTHTPVPAGHDRFDEALVRRYWSDHTAELGLDWERFYSLGTAEKDEPGAQFNMTYLALNFAGAVNGVAKLHGVASRALLHPWCPQLLESEVPVQTITNGVHLASWTDPGLARALGAGGGGLRPADFERAASALDLSELWAIRRAAKQRLRDAARQSLERSFAARGDDPQLLATMLEGLEGDSLCIGFARRFAPYKRAHLLFSDLDRLRALLDDRERPLRVFVAGKAHPRDERGKEILREIALHARSDELAGKVFFIEDHNLSLARALVQGTDIWLNNPIRMKEASGTSGMKAAANGVLNLSIGDGWWPEAVDGRNGWLLAGERVHADQTQQDEHDAACLYQLLEEEALPLYFDRDPEGRPLEWLERARRAIATIAPIFNTDRMVSEYSQRAYSPLAARGALLAAESYREARNLAEETRRLRAGFEALEVLSCEAGGDAAPRPGQALEARVVARLGQLAPDDVAAELLLTSSPPVVGAAAVRVVPLRPSGPVQDGAHTFTGRTSVESDERVRGVRLRPRRGLQAGDSLAGLARWA